MHTLVRANWGIVQRITVLLLIIYAEMILNCDCSISVQLIPNRSAKIWNNNEKSVTTVQNFVATV